MSNIIINNGIILTNSQTNLQPLIENRSKQKYITIDNTEYLLAPGTLVILVSLVDENLKEFDIEKDVELISHNQFLIHNGDWWVSVRNDLAAKKDIISNHKFVKLATEVIEPVVSIETEK